MYSSETKRTPAGVRFVFFAYRVVKIRRALLLAEWSAEFLLSGIFCLSHSFLEAFAGAELWRSGCLDLDLFAGAGVDSLPRRPLLHDERAESGDRNLLALGQSARNVLKNAIHSFLGRFLGALELSVYRVNDVGFIHFRMFLWRMLASTFPALLTHNQT